MKNLNKTSKRIKRIRVAGAAAAAMVFAAIGAFAQTGGHSGPGAGGHGRVMGLGMEHGPGAVGHGPMMGHGMGHGPAAGDHGPMRGPTAMLMKQDPDSAADMALVMDLFTTIR